MSEAPKVTPTQEPEAPVQTPPDYAGFNDPNSLAQAYRSSSTEARTQKQRADLLEQQLMQSLQPQRTQASPTDRLSEWGLPVDALDEFVNRAVEQKLQPLARAAGARNTVAAQYPDYVKYEQDVMGYINGDPDLQKTYNSMFNGDPVGTAEWAFLKFSEKQRRETPAPNGASSGDKAHAQIPSSRTGETRAQKANGDDDDVKRAFEHFQKTGDPSAFAKRRLRQVIPDDFFERNR